MMTTPFAQLLFSQLIAHLLTDYTLQNDTKAKDKNEKGFKSKFLIWHTFIMFVTSFTLSLQFEFILGSLFIALTHFLIDGLRPRIRKNKFFGQYAFFIDQALHLAVILLTVFVFDMLVEIEPLAYTEEMPKIFLITAGFLLAGKAGNIIIKEIFTLFNINVPKNNNDLQNAGKLIGIVERWLVLGFVLMFQYSAVGFLLASKSILRFKTQDGEEFNKTEYVLVGTLLSFSIAIGIGILINLLFPQ